MYHRPMGVCLFILHHHIPVQEGVGGEVQKSLGDTYDTFAGYQGTVNHFIETGMI
jgi:hypothetical protein